MIIIGNKSVNETIIPEGLLNLKDLLNSTNPINRIYVGDQ